MSGTSLERAEQALAAGDVAAELAALKAAAEEARASGAATLGEILRKLGEVQVSSGDLAAAEQTYRQAVAVAAPGVAFGVRLQLGDVLFELGRKADSEAMFREALDALPAADPERASALHRLATLKVQTGELAAAEAFYDETLEVLVAVVGETDRAVAALLDEVASLYVRMNRLEDAAAVLVEAAAMLEKSRPPDPLLLAHVQLRLASYYLSAPAPREVDALLYAHGALASLESVVGPRHVKVADVLEVLAVAQLRKGQLDGAKASAERALELKKESLAASDPALAGAHNIVAAVAAARGDVAGAQQQWQAAVALLEKADPAAYGEQLRGVRENLRAASSGRA